MKRAGFDRIIGVDIVEQPEYPFEFLKMDALELDENFMNGFDFIWASPPCQAYTFASKKARNLGKTYPDLIGRVRDMLDNRDICKPYVIENVTTAPIRKDLILCGTMFKLKIIRHRAFEYHTCIIRQKIHPIHNGTVGNGDFVTVAGHGGDGKASLKSWQEAMGIDWITDKKMLAEAVPPAYSEYIGRQLLKNHGSNEDKGI